MGTIERAQTARQPNSRHPTTTLIVAAAAAFGLGILIGRSTAPRMSAGKANAPASAHERAVVEPTPATPMPEVQNGNRLTAAVPSKPAVLADVPKLRPAPAARTTASAASLGAPASPAIDYAAQVQITKFNTEPENSIGAIWFTGEVFNASARTLQVKILSKAIGDRGMVLSSQETYTEPTYVPSLGRAVFRSYVESRGADVQHVSADVIAEPK